MEIATLILNVGQLIVALLCVPMLCDAMNNNQVTLKFGGYKLGKTVDEIIAMFKEDPGFAEELERAIKTNAFLIEGGAKAVKELRDKIKALGLE